MKIFECSKCHSTDVFIDKSGNNMGLYCADCGKWITWLNKEQQRLAKRQMEMNKQGRFASFDPLEDRIFLGMNIMGEAQKIFSGSRDKIIDGMTDTEKKAYDMGVSNTLSLVQQLVTDNDADFVVNTFDKVPTEYTYADLCRK